MNYRVFLFLLFSALLGGLVAQGLAATINVNPGDDVAGKVASAQPGDTVLFAAGTFEIKKPLAVQSGITLMGVSPNSSHLAFNLADDDESLYAMEIAGNASDVTIEELDITSNHGLIAMAWGEGYKNINITHNNLRSGGGESSAGVLVFAIAGWVPNDGLQITHNYFHDSPDCARNWTVFFATNSNFDYNQFYNINDGGQIVSPGPNVSCSYNYGTNIHRMGQEVSLVALSTFKCTGNVFYNYVEPYYDTTGVSIVGDSGKVEITDNYFGATLAPGSSFGPADSSGAQRFGFAIECTGQPCNVTGNTIVGTWAQCVCSDIDNANVSNNSIFGTSLWGNFGGEPGVAGNGSVSATKNSVHSDSASAPSPPANQYAGPRHHSM
jgi:hypothetical protein